MEQEPEHEANERRYRQLYEFNTSASRRLAEFSNQNAIEFAKLLIQSLFLIHGGALIALPAFMELFKFSVREHSCVSLGLFVCFGIGILAAFGAGMCGFFAMANQADASIKQWEAAGHAASATVLGDKGYEADASTERQLAAAANAKSDIFSARYSPWRIGGIAALIVSIVMFVIGIWLGMFAIAWGAT